MGPGPGGLSLKLAGWLLAVSPRPAVLTVNNTLSPAQRFLPRAPIQQTQVTKPLRTLSCLRRGGGCRDLGFPCTENNHNNFNKSLTFTELILKHKFFLVPHSSPGRVLPDLCLRMRELRLPEASFSYLHLWGPDRFF